MLGGGKLDRRITLNQVTTTNVKGKLTKTSTALATVAAKFNPVPTRERYGKEQVAASLDVEFVIRWSTDVSPIKAKDTLTFDSQTYEIVDAPMEMNGRMRFIAIRARLLDANA